MANRKPDRVKTERVREAFARVRALNNTPFVVEFIKRTNGQYRRMLCSTGVSRYVKGVGLAFEPTSYNLIGVYDMEKYDPAKPEAGYRFIDAESVISIVPLVDGQAAYYYADPNMAALGVPIATIEAALLAAFEQNVEAAIGASV
jgi:hypothetical protein